MKNLLICHRGALGDFICTWPALTLLRRSFPDASFALLGRPEYGALARRLGIIDRPLDAESAAFLPFFTGKDIPAALAGTDTAVLWLQEPDKPAGRLRDRGVQPLAVPPFPESGIHAADHHLEHISRAFSLPDYDFTTLLPQKTSPGTGTIILTPGSGSPAKNHPPEAFIGTAEKIRTSGTGTPVFITGPAESVSMRQTLEKTGFEIHTPPTVSELAALLENADACIGNDSGPSHLAAWLGIPSLALFRSTDPAAWGIRGRMARNLIPDTPEAIPDLVLRFLHDTAG